MPGFEIIGKEEQSALVEIFTKDNGILFAHGFDTLRHNNFRVRNFEQSFAGRMGVKYAQAVTSGSVALFVGLKALGIKPGDEVITQSFTFVATVEAILLAGAVPVITEIDKTFNMDPNDLEKKITSRTKAIIPVHMAGVSANMNRILQIAKNHKLKVLEDTAQGIGAQYNDKPLGTLGDMGAFSLDFGKTITTGEGGMLITNNELYYKEALAYHDHGHEYNQNVDRAEDTRHSWGFNFRMTEMNAAVGIEQLKKLAIIIDKSRRNKSRIKNAIAENVYAVSFREIPEGCEENYDSLYLIYNTKKEASLAVENLKKTGLGTKNVPDALKWHFAGDWEHMFTDVPLYRDTYMSAWPISANLLSCCIALPIMINWTEAFIDNYIQKLIPALSI